LGAAYSGIQRLERLLDLGHGVAPISNALPDARQNKWAMSYLHRIFPVGFFNTDLKH